MKPFINTATVRRLGLLILLLACLAGCRKGGSSQPQITLTAVDCPKESININHTIRVTGQNRRWSVKVDLTVSCGEQPKKAEIKVKYPWIPAFKAETDSLGKYSAIRISNAYDKPKGTVNVTVKGNNGSKTVPIAF